MANGTFKVASPLYRLKNATTIQRWQTGWWTNHGALTLKKGYGDRAKLPTASKTLTS